MRPSHRDKEIVDPHSTMSAQPSVAPTRPKIRARVRPRTQVKATLADCGLPLLDTKAITPTLDSPSLLTSTETIDEDAIYPIAYEDVFHVTDLVSEIVSRLPVRHRWRLATLDKGTYRAYQARYTHQYKVEGCGVELYFAPHTVRAQTSEESSVESGLWHKVSQRRTMHKVELIRELLCSETPVASLLAPTSYGKTLMAAILAFQYRGDGNKKRIYRLGDKVNDDDRAWLLVPNKCIENQLAELEKAYPGCIDWAVPDLSPVIVIQYAVSIISTTGHRRGNAMRDYAMQRLPDRLSGDYSDTGEIIRERWLEPQYRLGNRLRGHTLSPYNKVIVLGHHVMMSAQLYRGGQNPHFDMVWPPAQSGLLIIDESHKRSGMVSSIVGVPAARPNGRAILLSATKHVNVESLGHATGCVTYYDVAANVIADEKPLYTIRPQYYESADHVIESLREAVGRGAKRIVCVAHCVGMRIATLSAALVKSSIVATLIKEGSYGRVTVTLANGKYMTKTIEEFNTPDGADISSIRVMVADTTSIGVGLNIHADHVLIVGHNMYEHAYDVRRSHPYHPTLESEGYQDRIHYASLMTPTNLHQLVGRFVRIHNHNESIPITLAYCGPFRVAKTESPIDELAVRAIIAAFRLKQDDGAKGISLPTLDARCLALTYLVPNPLDWDDLTILYHLHPTSSAARVAYRDLPCRSAPLDRMLAMYMGEADAWVGNVKDKDDPECYDSTPTNQDHWTPTRYDACDPLRSRLFRYIEDEELGGYRAPTTQGETKIALLQHIERCKKKYGELTSKPEAKVKGRGKRK